MITNKNYYIRLINKLIKKCLTNSEREFVQTRDLNNLLTNHLFSLPNTVIKSTADFSNFLVELEKENRINEIPFAHRNEKNSRWRFYQLDYKPIQSIEIIEDWIKTVKIKILEQGFVFFVLEKNVNWDEIKDEIFNLTIDYTDFDFDEEDPISNIPLKEYLNSLPKEIEGESSDELKRLRELFNKFTTNQILKSFFNLNLGKTENYPINRMNLFWRIISMQFTNTELKRFQNIFYLKHRVTVVSSVSEYLTAINHVTQNLSTEVFYRGQASHTWKDIPSLYRNINAIKNEHLLFKDLILKNPNEFLHHSTTFEKLTKMQHYDLPTRLLDITSNPLVALYFAISNPLHDDTPSEVILYSCETENIKFYDSDRVSVLANLAQREKSFNFLDDTLKQFEVLDSEKVSTVSIQNKLIQEFNEQGEIMYLHHTIRGEKPYFLPIIDPRHICSSVIVKSKLDNERIKKQDGAFIIVGIDCKDPLKPAPIDFYLKNDQHQRIRIIIAEKDENNQNIAQNIRKELDRLSYHKGSLFPEIMNSALYIKDKYLNP